MPEKRRKFQPPKPTAKGKPFPIRFDPRDKDWLEDRSNTLQVPVAHIVRRAVQEYRRTCETVGKKGGQE